MVGLSRLVLLDASFVTTRDCCRVPPGPSTPTTQPRQGITRTGFGLLPVRSPLLRELFLFFGVLRCFSSPTCLHPWVVPPHHGRWVAPFGDPRIGLQAAPRG